MVSKRELRDYRKLEDIIRILRPLIEKHQASEEDEYKSIYSKQMQEQHEMRLMHQRRQENGSELSVNKKRSHPDDEFGMSYAEPDIEASGEDDSTGSLEQRRI